MCDRNGSGWGYIRCLSLWLVILCVHLEVWLLELHFPPGVYGQCFEDRRYVLVWLDLQWVLEYLSNVACECSLFVGMTLIVLLDLWTRTPSQAGLDFLGCTYLPLRARLGPAGTCIYPAASNGCTFAAS